MSVKIRLMRVGKKKQPTYRVVAADASHAELRCEIEGLTLTKRFELDTRQIAVRYDLGYDGETQSVSFASEIDFTLLSPLTAGGRRVEILEGDVLTSLMNTLPKPERYSYVFEGNSQVLDQILVSDNLLVNFPIDYDPVHVNSEFADQASDHDPQVARLDLRGRPDRAPVRPVAPPRPRQDLRPGNRII